MKLIIWDKDYNPPKGFEYGPNPTDFGVGRAAYLWEDPKPGEVSIFSSGKMMRLAIYRGGGHLEFADGRKQEFPIYHGIFGAKLIGLLETASREGFIVEHV